MEVSKLFDVQEKIYPYMHEYELHAFMEKSMNNFIEENSSNWEKVYKRRDKKIICTMIRLSHLASDEKNNRLMTVNNWVIVPRKRS